MKYDFITVPDRVGKDSTAANVIPIEGAVPAPGVSRIPMWIADMSFLTPKPVMDAIYERLKLESFGYFPTPDTYYDAILGWQSRRNGRNDISAEDIGYENGVLGGVASALEVLTSPGETVLLHSPTYIGFQAVMKNMGRPMVTSPLRMDEDGVWRMDYEDMEKKIRENHIHTAIFCSPHNPTGRVWEREELERAMDVYKRNDCVVISDEIWSDLIMPGYHHIPTQSISADARERTVAFYAPSKTFSLAGLIGSYHIIPNSRLRDVIRKREEMTHYNSQNVISLHALLGGYSEAGEEWLEELLTVLDRNHQRAYDFFTKEVEGVRLMRPQGTYMLYPDFTEYLAKHPISYEELLKKGTERGVIWQNGETFLWKNTIRLNLALPEHLLNEALRRMKEEIL